MTVNVVVDIGCQVGGKIVGYAVKILEGFPKSGRLVLHRFYADHRAGRPGDVGRKHNFSVFNCGRNAHAQKIASGRHGRQRYNRICLQAIQGAADLANI